MAAFDDRKTKQKQNPLFTQAAADILYLTRKNIFLEVLLSSYDKNTIYKPYSHFKNGK